MAEIMVEERPDVAPLVVVTGRLGGRDSANLLDTARSIPDDVVTIDARDIGALSPDGCEVLKYVGDQLADQGRTVRVAYRQGSRVERVLAETGTLLYPTLVFTDDDTA